MFALNAGCVLQLIIGFMKLKSLCNFFVALANSTKVFYKLCSDFFLRYL